MKKLMTTAMCSLVCLSSAMAAPANPMDGYHYDNISSEMAEDIWNDMKVDAEGKHCFRRAYVWTTDMKRNYNVDTRKIFIHYTNKWKNNLDFPTKPSLGFSWFSRDVKGANKGENQMAASNKTWGYHVAPLLQVDGKDVVMDGTLNIAYDVGTHYSRSNISAAWDLQVRPSTPNEWMEGLAVRGELLWQVRKAQLIKDLNKAKKKLRKASKKKQDGYRAKVANIQSLMAKLDMNPNIKDQDYDISCKRVDNIAEVDMNSSNEWCYTTTAPMYYYSEISLRLLAFGDSINTQYHYPIPSRYQTEENYNYGADNFVKTSFTKDSIDREDPAEDAMGEFKTSCKRVDSRSDCKKSDLTTRHSRPVSFPTN